MNWIQQQWQKLWRVGLPLHLHQKDEGKVYEPCTGVMSEEDEIEQESFDSFDDKLLYLARNGHHSEVVKLLAERDEGEINVDIDCRGNTKANKGWSPLHLAAYFGHVDVVKSLLDYGAEVNIINNVGDTALHRAAYTGRSDVVTLLIQYGADINLPNSEGLKAEDLARNVEVKNLIKATACHENRKLEEYFLKAARDGDTEVVVNMLKQNPAYLSCTDEYGNTALHLAAMADQRSVTVLLLQNGIDTAIKNKKDLRASDLSRSQQMKQVLDVKPVKDLQILPTRFEGLVLKKSRIFGNKPVWAVLERGVLSYFQNRGDASTGTKRKGMKYLDEATVKSSSDAEQQIVIHFSDGMKHTLSLELGNDADIANNNSNVYKQKWVNAIKEHIEFNTNYIHKGCVSESSEEIVSLGTMEQTLQTCKAHQQVLENQVEQLTTDIGKLTYAQKENSTAVFSVQTVDIIQQLKEIMQSSKDMSAALSHCVVLLQQQEEIRDLQLKEEMEKSRVLQEALHALATEHHELERSLSTGRRSPARYYDTDDDEFYDCDDDDDDNGDDEFIESVPEIQSFNECLSLASSTSEEKIIEPRGRLHLPVPMFSRADFSFWSILKQCIGKELSKITMPVIFNEPLSFLQRISEYMEYSYLIDRANQLSDPVERLQYISAFAVSAISSNWERIGKPFNPLLGETFELDRPDLGFRLVSERVKHHPMINALYVESQQNKPDLGFRLVSEQVSHHPPISAFHVESQQYKFHGTIHPKLKFWGKSVEVSPKGSVTLELPRHNEVYTWQNVNCCVHNVVVGKLWVEHYGVMEVVCQQTKLKTVLNFKQSSWFGKDLHKVEGYIYDRDKKKLKALYGNWVLGMYAVDAHTYEVHTKKSSHSSPSHAARPNGANSSHDNEDIPKTLHHYDLGLPGQICLWTHSPRPENTHQYFSFTSFAMTLNELFDDMKDVLPPTDARFRPDIKYLEDGQIDMAAETKNRLEEKQRAARKERKKTKEEYKPAWFRSVVNPYSNKEDWVFTNDYLKRDWSRCIDIF